MSHCPATTDQIDSACMSYRHDFGLLATEKRDSLRNDARYWLEAWMKEGLVLDINNLNQTIVNLRLEIAELKKNVASAEASTSAENDLRTQVILLQSENNELKRQLEKATNPEYLATALTSIGVADNDWQKIAEQRTEQVAALNSALKVAKQAVVDWLHIYAHDFCDEADVKAAQERVHKHGTIAYIANVEQVIREAYQVASYEDVLPEHPVIGQLNDVPLPINRAYLTTDKDGSTVLSTVERVWSDDDIQDFEISTVNLVDGKQSAEIIRSLRFETLRLYNDIQNKVRKLRDQHGKASGTLAEEAAWDMANRVMSYIKQIKFDGQGAFVKGQVISNDDVTEINRVLTKFSHTIENQKTNGPDVKQAVIANYGDLALVLLRKIATASKETA
jgi:FtsZ-binding cell division protein ZapB